MPNIKPISDLRNYGEVLRDVTIGSPVFLTKNGRGSYEMIIKTDISLQTFRHSAIRGSVHQNRSPAKGTAL